MAVTIKATKPKDEVRASIHAIVTRSRDDFGAEHRKLLSVIGPIAVKAVKRNFALQRSPQSGPWPEKYPNIPFGPRYINIAGAISDLEGGPFIKAKRYDKRPALDGMEDTIEFESTSKGFDIYSSHAWADHHVFGKKVKTTLTNTIKDNLAKLMKKTRKERDNAPSVPHAQAKAGELSAMQTLARRVFGKRKRVLRTKLNKRNFLELDQDTLDRIRSETIRYFQWLLE